MTLTDIAAFVSIGFLLTLFGYYLFRWASRVRVEGHRQRDYDVRFIDAPNGIEGASVMATRTGQILALKAGPGQVIHTDDGTIESLQGVTIPVYGPVVSVGRDREPLSYIAEVWNAIGEEADALWQS